MHGLTKIWCAFAHSLDAQRSKLEGKSRGCIFLGYSHDQFGYRLWEPKSEGCFAKKMWSSLKIKLLKRSIWREQLRINLRVGG